VASLAVAATAGTARANTAANTRIINNADLSYNDGTGTKHATSQVTVTVALKPAAPTITAMASKTGAYPTPLVDDYVLTNNANGPDTFVLTTGTNTLVNTTSVTATPGAPAPATPITLGATVTGSGSSTTVLIVPADGVSDNSVNGITVGDKVVVNGEERTVSAINDNATGTSTITVGALSSAPGAGVLVAERATVHATVTPANITNAGQNVSVNVNMTATSQADAGVSTTSGDVGNLFYSGSATLTKYVRNVTNANGSGGSTTTFNGATYFNNPTSLVAKPDDTLEYLLLSTNTSSSADVTQVVLTDLVPVDYVDLVTNAYNSKAFRYVPDVSVPGTVLDLTAANTDDAASYDAAFDTTANAAKGKITAWIGGAAPTYNTPGTIAAGKSNILLYQVKVKK